jgi:hypothetical protein
MAYYFISNVKTDKLQGEPGTALGAMDGFYPVEDKRKQKYQREKYPANYQIFHTLIIYIH